MTSLLDASSSQSELLSLASSFMASLVTNLVALREGYAIVANAWELTSQQRTKTP